MTPTTDTETDAAVLREARRDPIVCRILDRIEEEAAAADRNAEQACVRSKYSIQDYWMCVEFKFQRLHDELARELGLSRRCRTFAFRERLAEFKRQVAADASNKEVTCDG